MPEEDNEPPKMPPPSPPARTERSGAGRWAMGALIGVNAILALVSGAYIDDMFFDPPPPPQEIVLTMPGEEPLRPGASGGEGLFAAYEAQTRALLDSCDDAVMSTAAEIADKRYAGFDAPRPTGRSLPPRISVEFSVDFIPRDGSAMQNYEIECYEGLDGAPLTIAFRQVSVALAED